MAPQPKKNAAKLAAAKKKASDAAERLKRDATVFRAHKEFLLWVRQDCLIESPFAQRVRSKQDREKLSKYMNLPLETLADRNVHHVRCSICAEPLANSPAEIKRHIRSHLPEKMRPFVCNTDGCGFTTAQKPNLKAHQRQHAGALVCALAYVEDGKTHLCRWRTNVLGLLTAHKTDHPRHRPAEDTIVLSRPSSPPTAVHPSAMDATADDQNHSLSPVSSSCFSPPASQASTRATSSSPMASSMMPIKHNEAPRLTGRFSLPREDFESYLYGSNVPQIPRHLLSFMR